MKRIARILISLVLLGIAAGIAFFAWRSYQEFSSIRAQLEARRNRLEQGQQALAQLKKTELKVQEHQEDFAKITQAIPSDIALPALYDHIQSLRASTGLLLESIEGAEQQESSDALSRIVVSINVTGSYEAMKQFLRALEISPRFFNVRTLSVHSASDGVLAVTMELIAYAKP